LYEKILDVFGVENGVFAGYFEKSYWLDVVFCVAKRGEMRG